jgi:hypothetical protein
LELIGSLEQNEFSGGLHLPLELIGTLEQNEFLGGLYLALESIGSLEQNEQSFHNDTWLKGNFGKVI